MRRTSGALTFITALIGLILVVGLLGLGYLYIDTNSELDDEKDRSADLRTQVEELQARVPIDPGEELAQVLEQVGAVYELPEGEEPTLVTVDDVTQLEGQAFFEKAANGDKLLIYNDLKQAILYRPSTGKVINSGPIAITGEAPAAEADPPGESTE